MGGSRTAPTGSRLPLIAEQMERRREGEVLARDRTPAHLKRGGEVGRAAGATGSPQAAPPHVTGNLVYNRTMIRVNIADAKAHLSRYLGRVEQGEDRSCSAGATCPSPRSARCPSAPAASARSASTAAWTSRPASSSRSPMRCLRPSRTTPGPHEPPARHLHLPLAGADHPRLTAAARASCRSPRTLLPQRPVGLEIAVKHRLAAALPEPPARYIESRRRWLEIESLPSTKPAPCMTRSCPASTRTPSTAASSPRRSSTT